MRVKVLTIDKSIQELLEEKILIIDGGMGTLIQQYNLTEEDFGGSQYQDCNEVLVKKRPEIIKSIHMQYLEAGADIIETNTFGASVLVLNEYGLGDEAYELNYTAAKIARECADKFHNRFVAGSMGPTTKSLVLMDDISFDEMQASYYQQVLGLVEGGVDVLFIETAQDTLNMKSAILAVKRAEVVLKKRIPFFLTASIDVNGKMLAGQDIEAFYTSVRPFNPIGIGMNCAVGPYDLREPLSILREISDLPIIIFPNAGLPDENGQYNEGPEEFSETIRRYSEQGYLNLAGGCCGTTPEHIKKLSNKLSILPPRKNTSLPLEFKVSGIEYVEPDKIIRPIIIGERTNIQGSRAFKKLMQSKEFDKAIDVAKSQVQKGAQIVDVCLENTEIDEIELIDALYPKLNRAIKTPIMIDSTSPEAIERALTYCQGKTIINSINLESGFEKFEKLITIAKKYGSSVVVGLIDEDEGMAFSYERKIALADRMYDLLVNTYEMDPSDLIFDLLVFTVDSGLDENTRGTAKATIDAISHFKSKYPESMTVLGISNISFGLPIEGRKILNAVFFYHCVQAGLDLAIVNPQTLLRYNTIDTIDIQLAENLIFEQNLESLQKFTSHIRAKKPQQLQPESTDISPAKMLNNSIVQGTGGEITGILDSLLETMRPLDIINTNIMGAMGEVGSLFEQGKMIVTEVLQSAEVVKAAVSHLEPLIQSEITNTKRRFLIATVKGDVHDIGKNLVRIIFESNGYEVIDIGIRVDSQKLIRAINEYKPDIIGLSGLLVKSSRYMVSIAEHLNEMGINIPLIVGGAALNSKFVENKIIPVSLGTVIYANDAMSGLTKANQLFNSMV